MGEKMMLRSKAYLAAAVLAGASLFSSAAEAIDAIGMVPPDALALVVVDELKALDVKVAKSLESLQLPLAGLLTAMEALPGLPDCLDQESRIVVAVFKGAKAGDEPAPVAFVPVKDFDAFTELFGGEEEGDFVRLTVTNPPRIAVEKDGFAVVTREDNKLVLQRVLGASGGIREKLDDDMGWLDQRDVAAILTDRGMSLLCEKLQEGISVAQTAIREKGNDAMGTADVLSVYRDVFAVIDQEVELVGIGLDVQESGDLMLHVRKRFLPAGQFAQCLEVSTPPADMLAGLPAEPFVVAGGSQFTPAMGRLMMELSVELMEAAPKLYGISKEQGESLVKSSEPLMEGIESLVMMLAVGSPEDTVYSRMIAVMETEDAQKYMKAYEKYLLEFSDLVKGSSGVFSLAVESESIEIDGREGLEIVMQMPENLLDETPEAEAAFEKIVGPGGKIRLFVVAADERNVLIGYTSKDLLRRAISSLEKSQSISQDKFVKVAAEKLPAGNFGQGFFSPQGLVRFVNDVIEAVVPEEQRIEIPAFPETPPVAWIANAEGATADAQIVIPGEIIRSSVMYAGQVRQLIESARNQ